MVIKRIAALLLCLCVMIAMPMAVSAENESMKTVSKIYTLHISETYGAIEASPDTPAFWEYPVLRAGEDYIEGMIVVHNDSAYIASMSLNGVTLPYGDDAKLSYLDHLMLTVKKDGEVIYDNTYAHVNDEEGGLKIDLMNMAPGEEHMFTVKLRCLYTYEGDPYADASQLTWNFGAKSETTVVEEPEGLPEWAIITVITFAAMIVVLIIIMIVRAIVRTVKKKKNTIDKP